VKIDSANYVDTISFKIKDTTTANIANFTNIDTTINFNGYDSATIYLPGYQFSLLTYAAGHDVVIVWPIAGNAIVDSFTMSVFVIDDTGIPIISDNNGISFYPNPANNILYFDSKYSINDFEYFRILDIVGEEQSRFIPNENSIPINNLSPGMYFIEVKLKDGTVITEKFIRE
jgi:hypothetical protein